jgi:hypothetical protein
MRIGDLVWIVAIGNQTKCGIGVYLGLGSRPRSPIPASLRLYETFLWYGRVATFDAAYWEYNVISCGEDYGKK